MSACRQDYRQCLRPPPTAPTVETHQCLDSHPGVPGGVKGLSRIEASLLPLLYGRLFSHLLIYPRRFACFDSSVGSLFCGWSYENGIGRF